MSAPPTVRLTDEAAQRSADFGSKASSLARLLVEGFPVPDGVAVAAHAYLDFVDGCDVPRAGEHGSFGAWAELVHRRLMEAPPPWELAELIEHQLTAGGLTAPWVVRSSAIGEDGAVSSFAGQLESVLDVDAAGLGPAIRAVWASAWSPRAAAYREARGLLAVHDLPVGVLVQPFIEPELAGVLFTSSPIPSVAGMLVEAVRGRGELLVSGAESPARYAIDNQGRAHAHLDEPEFEVPAELLTQLFHLGQAVAGALAAPQDIEWVYAARRLSIVQSRPITTPTR
jgi:phosphoenolpyruvate synthase/pyruvate phosphate dikinase